jgi:hypothetical protein
MNRVNPCRNSIIGLTCPDSPNRRNKKIIVPICEAKKRNSLWRNNLRKITPVNSVDLAYNSAQFESTNAAFALFREQFETIGANSRQNSLSLNFLLPSNLIKLFRYFQNPHLARLAHFSPFIIRLHPLPLASHLSISNLYPDSRTGKRSCKKSHKFAKNSCFQPKIARILIDRTTKVLYHRMLFADDERDCEAPCFDLEYLQSLATRVSRIIRRFVTPCPNGS